MGHHGLWSKKAFYDRAAEVPFLARLPGTIPAASTCAALCSLTDLAPTFVEMANADPMDTDGDSLLPLLRGAEEPDRTVTSEVADVNGGDFEWVGKMVRRGPWKLWQHQAVDGPAYPPALFNLELDPEERTDRAADPACATVVSELADVLHSNWAPCRVTTAVRQQLQDWKRLEAWARVVEPALPETYVWPGEETEADLELL
jgi:choline-sulfatase